ncbi:7135_t:CDS:10 [Acaulospora colombiana]|uniref:7135_t:CDS:1 n=1 Tax=Acaulospora colombiana TaxID=27376 RepID=A0ACA9K431_9GLOM|nr:7135_t:CDS:10 [Acaulospora colombiana]
MSDNTANDAPLFLSINPPPSTANSGDVSFSLRSGDQAGEQINSQVVVARLRKHLDAISALVKDVHEKLNKDVLDSKGIQDSLKEIQCDVEKFSSLQQSARYYALADEIDELGVGIWNSSITLRASHVSDGIGTGDELVALFRQVGFFMVKAGAEMSAGIEAKSAVKLLALANKVGKSWLDCGRSDKADELLRSVTSNSVHDESNMDLAENAVNLCLEENPNDVLASSLKLKIMKQRNLNPIPFEEGMDILIEEKLSDTRNSDYIEKAIISKFNILGSIESADFELNDAIKSIEVTLGFEQRHGIVISHKTKVACQMNKQYDLARKWYFVAYKWMAAGQAEGRNAAILQRKIALCYLEVHLLADAIDAVQQAQTYEHNSAANFYILYHIAMERRQMDQGDGFHGDMLAMAANEAYQQGHKTILIEALKEILSKHKSGEDVAHIDMLNTNDAWLTSSRKRIRKVNLQVSLKDCICGYFEIAFSLIESNKSDKVVQQNDGNENTLKPTKTPLKDLEWFYKTAWNMGLEFCQQADEGSDPFAIRLFDIVYKFLCEYPEETLEHTNQKKFTIFASLCGKLFLARRQESLSQRRDLLQSALENIDQYKKLKKVLGKRKRDDAEDNQTSTQSDAILVILFEFEAKVKLGLWNELQKVLDAAEAHDFEVPPKIFERMAELLIHENECPSTGRRSWDFCIQ